MCAIAAAVSTDNDGNGLCVCILPAPAAERPTHGHTQHTPVGPATKAKRLRCRAVCCVCHAVLQQLLEESERCSQMRCSGSGVDASGTERADVPGMRCCCSCFGANGAARCDGVALVLMQAGRVSPARTRTAAESTMCSIVAAVSTDIDGNGM